MCPAAPRPSRGPLPGRLPRAILANLAKAVEAPGNGGARAAMALASSEVAIAFSQTGLGMVHGFAHPVGAIGGVAHGVANAIILPYIVAACAKTDPEPFAGLAAAAGLHVEGLAAAGAAGRPRGRHNGHSRPGSRSRAAWAPSASRAISCRRCWRTPSRTGTGGPSPRAFSDEELAALLEKAYGR